MMEQGKDHHLSVGRQGEELAARYLRRRGYKILESNYRTKFGEIDLICEKKRQLVFVEVRTRSSDDFGGAAASVGRDKRRRLCRAAQAFIIERGLDERRARFDVVAVKFGGRKPGIEHLADAFDLTDI